MSAIETGGGAYLHDKAPLLDRHDLIAKFALWNNGVGVESEVHEVGQLPAGPKEVSLLEDPLLLERDFGRVWTDDPLYSPTASLRIRLRALAHADMARASLFGHVAVFTYAGMYNQWSDHAEPAHADAFEWQQVRWNVSHGGDGTYGALGPTCKDDVTGLTTYGSYGTVSPMALQSLAIQEHGEAAVVRFTTSDIHGSPSYDGPRLLTIATYRFSEV